jgi:hypothetical protein
MQELSTYSGKYLAKYADVAGAISDGFRTIAFPAARAPITGSIDNARNESRKGSCQIREATKELSSFNQIFSFESLESLWPLW